MITYNDFMKHAAVVTRSPNIREREILQGVKHLDDGSLAVTDSHRLYIAKDMHDRADGAVLDTNGKVLDGNYPDVFRLLPYQDPEQELELNLKEFLRDVDTIYSAGKLNPNTKKGTSVLDFNGPYMEYVSNDLTIEIEQQQAFDVVLTLDSKYLLDALKLFKATGSDSITMKIYDRMRPILLEAENLQVIILPVRRI